MGSILLKTMKSDIRTGSKIRLNFYSVFTNQTSFF
jgi:hypothetical protein